VLVLFALLVLSELLVLLVLFVPKHLRIGWRNKAGLCALGALILRVCRARRQSFAVLLTESCRIGLRACQKFTASLNYLKDR